MSFGQSGSLNFRVLLSIFTDFIFYVWSKEALVSGTTSPCSSSSETAENFYYKVRILFHVYLLQFLFWDPAFGYNCILLFSAAWSPVRSICQSFKKKIRMPGQLVVLEMKIIEMQMAQGVMEMIIEMLMMVSCCSPIFP